MPEQTTQPQTTTKSLTVDEASDILNAAIKATESRLPEVQRFELHQREARLFALSGLFADINLELKGFAEQARENVRTNYERRASGLAKMRVGGVSGGGVNCHGVAIAGNRR